MSFNYIQKSKSALSDETLRLLEAIDSFQYEVLNPDYQTLGDIHKNVTVEVLDEFPTVKHKNHTTIGDLKRQLKDIQQYNREAEEFNLTQSKTAGFTKHKVNPGYIEKYLGENTSDRDTSSVTSTLTYNPTESYTRDEKNGRVVAVKFSNDMRNVVTRYISGMMRAFFDSDTAMPLSYVKEIEDLIAEYAMLRLLYAFYKSEPSSENAVLLKTAFYGAECHQYYPGVAHIGQSAYLFQWYADVQWERLFRTVHSQIKDSDEVCARLKNLLGLVAPTSAERDVAAKLLYDYLSGMSFGDGYADSFRKMSSCTSRNSLQISPRLSASCRVIDCKNLLFRFVIGYTGEKLKVGDKLRYVRGVRFLQETSVITLSGPNGEFKCVVSDALVSNLMEIMFLGIDYELRVFTTIEINSGDVAEVEVCVEHLPVRFMNVIYSIEMTLSNAAFCKVRERQTLRHQGMHSEPVKDSPFLIEYIHLFRLWCLCCHGVPRTDEYDSYSTIMKVNGEMRFFTGMTKAEFNALQCEAENNK